MEVQHQNRRSFVPAWLRKEVVYPRTRARYLLEMLEVVIGLGMIGGMGLLLPATLAWQNITFAAFFLLIFAIAVRYRPVTAYSAGLLAAVSYSLLLWQDAGSLVPFASAITYIEPFVLFFAGVVMSTLFQSQQQRMSTAERLCGHLDEELREAKQHYQTALAINKELESQVAGQSVSIAIISDKLANLGKFNGADLYKAILDVALQALEAGSCTLYLLHDGRLRMRARLPEPEPEPDGEQQDAQTVSLNDPLISKVLRQRQVCSVHDLLAGRGRNVPQTLAVMAGPLLDAGGQVVGIVTVDRMSMHKFHPSTVRLFRSILSIASMTLQPPQQPAQAEEELAGELEEEDTLILQAVGHRLEKKLWRKNTSSSKPIGLSW